MFALALVDADGGTVLLPVAVPGVPDCVAGAPLPVGTALRLLVI